MKNKAIATAALGALLFAGAAFAQPVAGDHEIQVAAGFFKPQDEETGNIAGDVSYGYYLPNPAWQVGLRQALSYTFVDDAEDIWQATTIPFLNYHFLGLGEGNVVPFLGAFVGAVWNDDDVTGTVGPNVGAKFFLTDQTFFVARYRYEWFWDDFGEVDNEIDDGNHVGTVGLGFVWGGAERPRLAKATALEDHVRRAENAADRASKAAASAQAAAERTEAAAKRIERIAAEAEAGFHRGVRK
ncbi:MAG: hypothetical protein KatS3mg076_3212 [Candidatus Binatia bacterium]|nr:MAG: hypothetical protein KatS3mg076_3212 [Candidatus Binatia bacterium]